MSLPRPLHICASLLALATLLPLVAVLLLAAGVGPQGSSASDPGAWAHLFDTGLAGYALNSLALMLMTGAGVIAVGVGAAWLTALTEFPGRRFLQTLLVLPLALPGYVIAYAYTDFLQFSGPVQSGVRALAGLDGAGWKAAGLWFPEVRSLPGAALMFTLVLYPYVYLPVRAAFAAGGANLTEAARTLGMSPWVAFVRVALPLARPAIAGGCALALMETLADYGAVAHFAVDTYTTGIYKAWFGLGDKTAAARLACLLLLFTLVLVWLERFSRGRARFGVAGARSARAAFRFSGVRGVAAATAAALPVLLGFVLPVLILARLAYRDADAFDSLRFLALACNSLTVGLLAAAVAVAAALTIAYSARLDPRMQPLGRLATLGYAMPGAVIAVGVLVPLAGFDNWLDGLMRARFGVSTGLLITGTVAALVFACVVRFMAVAQNNIEAGLARVTPSMDDAARAMGFGTGATMLRVHVPMIARSLMIAALLVFVDAIKELPATLAVRPFNFDTLATYAYNLAKDERLGEAAWPCLAIVLVSLAPVLVVSKSMAATVGRARGGG